MEGEEWHQPYRRKDKRRRKIRVRCRHHQVSGIDIDNLREEITSQLEHDLCELCNILVPKFRGDKQETALEDTKTRGYRYSVEVFDLDRLDILFLVLNGDLVQIPLFALQQEKERSLRQPILNTYCSAT